jgi:MFS family permease
VRDKRALVVLAVGALDFGLEQAIVAPALPVIQRHYHASASSTAWLLTGFLIAAAVVTPLAGRLGDNFGRRRALLVSLGLFALGSLVSALAGSIEALIAGRVIQGLGAGMAPLALALAREHIHPARVPTAVGLLVASASIGTVVGLLLAGLLVDHGGVAAIFWLLFALAAVLALAVRLAVQESSPRGEGAVDLAGAALLAGGLGCVMLTISRGNQWGWGSPRTLALLTASGLLAIAFWVRERTAAQPLIDPRVLATRSIWSANLAMLALGFSLLISFTLVPLIGGYPKITGYGLGLSTTEIGLMLVPSGLATIVAGLLGGRVIARTGARAQATIGGACAAITYTLLAVLPWSAATLALAMIPLGFGVGLALGAITDLVVLSAPPERTGATVAVNTVIRMAAAALGAQVAIAIVTTAHSRIPGLPAARGFTDAFVMAAIAALVTIAAVLLTPARAADPAVTPSGLELASAYRPREQHT